MQKDRIKMYKGTVRNIRESKELIIEFWTGNCLSARPAKKVKAPLADMVSTQPLSKIFWKYRAKE